MVPTGLPMAGSAMRGAGWATGVPLGGGLARVVGVDVPASRWAVPNSARRWAWLRAVINPVPHRR